jgi:hypothetical protein
MAYDVHGISHEGGGGGRPSLLFQRSAPQTDGRTCAHSDPPQKMRRARVGFTHNHAASGSVCRAVLCRCAPLLRCTCARKLPLLYLSLYPLLDALDGSVQHALSGLPSGDGPSRAFVSSYLARKIASVCFF